MGAREVLLQQVLDLADVCGWRRHHQRPGRTLTGWRTTIQGEVGLPDLLLCRPPRLVFAETKSPGDIPTDEQWEWLHALAQVPVIEVYVWWPKDWDEIVRVLKREEAA